MNANGQFIKDAPESEDEPELCFDCKDFLAKYAGRCVRCHAIRGEPE